ncbi:MAG: EamA family transporter [Candidatus Omnitrophica bacterium]|nr:EamA family transporter [Candidatus Omnitrophota bacterium]
MMLDWKIFAVGSAFFAGLTAVLAKVGVKNVPSNLATLIRTIVIIIFLAVLVGLRREWKNPFSIDKFSLLFLVLSAIATGLSWICYFRALQTGPASLVSPIDKLSLVFTIILSVIFLGERLGAYQLLGACLMAAGTLIIILK